MAYSGRYRVKNPKKYKGDHTNVIYRSLWEKYAFKWCDDNNNVKTWSSEETIIPYLYEVDKRWHRYFVDLKITMRDGKTFFDRDKTPQRDSKTQGTTQNKEIYIRSNDICQEYEQVGICI